MKFSNNKCIKEINDNARQKLNTIVCQDSQAIVSFFSSYGENGEIPRKRKQEMEWNKDNTYSREGKKKYEIAHGQEQEVAMQVGCWLGYLGYFQEKKVLEQEGKVKARNKCEE